MMPSSGGIKLQKKHGQYFLRDKSVVRDMVWHYQLKNVTVMEIGCGDGFLTREILAQPINKLVVFEIDPMWAKKVGDECQNDKLSIVVGDFLEADLQVLNAAAPVTLLANLPYHITFPILHRIHKARNIIQRGVVMIQDEVAEKIVKVRGKGYGYVSLFFQYYFDWKLLTKIPPTAFFPEPKVHSRLIAFTAKAGVTPIIEEKHFWRFIKICFAYPRRTLRNNIVQSHIPLNSLPEDLLALRAQQLSMAQFLQVWDVIRPLFITTTITAPETDEE